MKKIGSRNICEDCVHTNKPQWVEPCNRCYLDDDKPHYRRKILMKEVEST